MNNINSELILRFQPRWKTDIEVMVGKTNTKAKYSTSVGTRYENGLVNNFETHGASYLFCILLVNSELLTFGMMTFLNLAFHIREKVGLETGHKPLDLTSSAYVRQISFLVRHVGRQYFLR